MFNLFKQSKLKISSVVVVRKFDKRQPPVAVSITLDGQAGTVGGAIANRPKLRKSPAVRKRKKAASPPKTVKKGTSPPKTAKKAKPKKKSPSPTKKRSLSARH